MAPQAREKIPVSPEALRMTRPLPDSRRALARVVIEDVQPAVDGGRFPIKRVVGDRVVVEADVFADGHDVLACRLLWRADSAAEWVEAPMTPLGNDRWRAAFPVDSLGRFLYTIEGWVDRFLTWRRDLAARIAAGQDVPVETLMGAALIEEAADRATGDAARRLRGWARALREADDAARRNALALDEPLGDLAARYPDRAHATRCGTALPVVVDRTRARCSAWYEVFPRSCAAEPGRHGTFRDCAAWLPYIAGMGFDVLYFPPIHPIGRAFRKGPNNAPDAGPDDVGSPWAIGAVEGGHTAVHPALGTLEDFRALVAQARAAGLEVALDIAWQCAPDHPYVGAHPEWFRARPDGTIQYAENPPKKYQDIYPFDFESPAWRDLWTELRDVVVFWIEQGVRIFRVDNPHTKPFAFWEWLITDLKASWPDLIFLSEAFTRPRVMYRLAKLGFSQSYTYFTWRNSKAEIASYFEELTGTGVAEFFRPNLWPNTPDILHATLQTGGRPAFVVRAVLAATLGANWGIYGPAFELLEHEPREPGSEEYRNSEKYQLRPRDREAAHSLRPLLTRLNAMRRENTALQRNDGLRFHETDNPQLLCYSKTSPDRTNALVTVVNLDPLYEQAGWVTLDLEALGLAADAGFGVHDLLSDQRFLWRGARNYVQLSPDVLPAHVLRVEGGPR
jgi:starch synthase (maltosyl-transferring)